MELKAHVLRVMEREPECRPGAAGVPYRVVEDVAGLGLGLEAQDGWLTWSLLAALAHDAVEAIRRGRRLYWRLRQP